MKRKSSSGRHKIPIEKIKNKSHLQVTFSKRRSGLFKKASELSTLCGVEIAILVFSPADKAFSFGHPDVESIINRYLSRNPDLNYSPNKFIEAHRNATLCDLNIQLTQVMSQLEIEKKRGEDLDKLRKARQRQFWWENPIDKLNLHELQQLKFSMEELKKNVASQRNKILMEHASLPSTIVGTSNGIGSYYLYGTKPPEINLTSTLPNDAYNFTYHQGYM